MKNITKTKIYLPRRFSTTLCNSLKFDNKSIRLPKYYRIIADKYYFKGRIHFERKTKNSRPRYLDKITRACKQTTQYATLWRKYFFYSEAPLRQITFRALSGHRYDDLIISYDQSMD